MIQTTIFNREVSGHKVNNLGGYGFHEKPSYSTHSKAPFEKWLFEKLPERIYECPFPAQSLSTFDKIFASQWIDPQTVVTGSKDNKLTVWDLSNRVPTCTNIGLPPGSATPVAEHCGIHSIAKNSTISLLVTGAGNPCDLAVFSVPDFKLVATLVGHSDWSFACDFVSETRVVSGSRDTNFAIWNLDDNDLDSSQYGSVRPNKQPDSIVAAHSAKIRDLKVGRNTNTLASLSADASVKIWDCQTLQSMTQITMEDDKELVCLDYDDTQHFVVVGSLEGTTVYDTRSGEVTLALAAYDSQWGVRSVNLRQHMLASGGGYGSLGFFDIRKGATEEGFVKLINYDNKESILASPGYLDKKSSHYASYWAAGQGEYSPAIYTIQWDPTGTRLFAAGGPIMLGLRGCYAALY